MRILRTPAKNPLAYSGVSHSSDFAARPGTKSEYFFSLYLYGVIFLCFFTYSIRTPLGYLSFEDIAIGAALVFFGAIRVGSSPLILPNMPVVILSIVAFLLIAVSTLIANVGLDISPIVKYAIFLIAIPASFCLAGCSAPSDAQYLKILQIFRNCGNIFLAFVVGSLILGFHTGSGENYSISLFGQPIYKNAVGTFLLYCAMANVIEFCISRRKLYFLLYLTALACCLFLNVRGPILAGLVLPVVIYWKFVGINLGSFLRILGLLACLFILAYVLYSSGVADQQFHRLLGNRTTYGVGSNASRIILWRYALALINESPYFGIGYGGFFYDQSRDWMYGLREPHDNILQILSEGGLFGLLAFLALLFVGFRSGASSRTALGIKLIAIGYLLQTLVDIIWARGNGHLFWILFYLFALKPRVAFTKVVPMRLRQVVRAPAWH